MLNVVNAVMPRRGYTMLIGGDAVAGQAPDTRGVLRGVCRAYKAEGESSFRVVSVY